MIEYNKIIPDKIEKLLPRLVIISKQDSDMLFLDYSMSRQEYIVVNKENQEDRFILYVKYFSHPFIGNWCNYRYAFSLAKDNELTEIKGEVGFKSFTLLALIPWVSISFFGLYQSIYSQNYNNALQIGSSIIILIFLLLVDYFMFKKRVNKFFFLLSKNPPKEIQELIKSETVL